MRLSIKMLLISMLGLMLVVPAAQGVYTGLSLHEIDTLVADVVDKRLPSFIALGHLNADIAAVRIAQNGVLLAGPEFTSDFEQRLAKAEEAVAKDRALYEPLLTRQADRDFYAAFAKAWAGFQTSWQQVIAEKQAQHPDKAIALFFGDSRSAYAASRDAIQAAADHLNQNATAEGGQVRQATSSTVMATYVALGIVLLVGIGTILVSLLRVIRPLGRMTAFMDVLATGDTSQEVPESGRRDEIGAMAAAVLVFKNGIIRTRQLEEEGAQDRLSVEAQRKTAMRQLADSFEKEVGSVVDMVSSAATEMQATAQQLTGSAQETSAQSAAVSSAAEEASSNVSAVAGAAEELGSSVAEISRQVEHSVRNAQEAVSEAEATAAIVTELSQTASRIDAIVEIISNIAGQTNLLALNATIEAARAGEAGKGFAVVAAEVKGLASQTAKATAEIGQQITAIQATTSKAVTAIGGITGTIRQISEVANTIAHSVQQQGAATREIVQSVTQASAGTNEVTANISGVARAAEETGAGAGQVLTASSELAHQAEHLRRQMQNFLSNVRAA